MNKRLEERIYLRLGWVVAFSALIVLLISFLANFFFSSENVLLSSSNCQPYTCKGIDVKENTRAFKSFLLDIKSNDGVLVFGSSETGAFGRENYHGLLNEYFDCGHDFSVLAGAGRTAHVFYPPMLNNKEFFKDLNVLYFINPTYWRESLNYFQLAYYERYNSPSKVYSVKSELQDLGLYDEFAKNILGEFAAEYRMNEFREPFVEIKNYLSDRILNENLEKKVDEVSTNISNPDCARNQNIKEMDSSYISSLKNELFLEKNITKAFNEIDPKKFVKIKDSDFQTSALKGFNAICKEVGINITYVLGPYNAVYCNYYNEDWCAAHEETVDEIRDYLESEDARYIDCSDLSYVKGSFNDVQHHSKYAAWIIADRISKYYEKAN